MKNISKKSFNKSIELYESVIQTIRKEKRKIDEDNFLKEKRTVAFKRKTFSTNTMGDKDFQKLSKCYHTMKNSNKYVTYKKAFDEFVRIIGIEQPDAIHHITLKSGTKDQNTVTVRYFGNRRRYIIPNGSMLYHKTTVDNITHLNPSFKSKNGYFYSEPRIYFSLEKNMSNLAADKGLGTKMHVYIPEREHLVNAYVDSALPSFNKAIFIPTRFPIKVKKVTPETKTESINIKNLTLNEEIYKESVNDMVTGVKTKIGEHTRSKSGKELFKQVWKNVSDKIQNIRVGRELNPMEYKNFKRDFNTMSTTNSFSEYRNARKKIIDRFNLKDDDLIVDRTIETDSKIKPGYKKVLIDYTNGRRRITIPNGSVLIHKSPVSGLTELKPTFRSKTKGKFMYPNNRVYFSIGKKMPDNKMGTSNQKMGSVVTPKNPIRTAFIDPTWKDYSTGSVFVDTDQPIPVKPLNNK